MPFGQSYSTPYFNATTGFPDLVFELAQRGSVTLWKERQNLFWAVELIQHHGFRPLRLDRSAAISWSNLRISSRHSSTLSA